MEDNKKVYYTYDRRIKMACDFLNYITRDSVMILEGTDKLHIMDELIDRAAELTKLNRDNIYRLTWKREKMMTTAVGKGLALPHIRVNDIPAPVILIGVSKNDIADYIAQDGKPVRVVVFLAAPDENPDAYLQLLSSVSRKMREDGVIEKLLESTDNSSVLYNTVTAL